MSKKGKQLPATATVHVLGAVFCAVMVGVSAAMFLIPGVKSRAVATAEVERLSAVSQELDRAAGTVGALQSQLDKLARNVEVRDVTLFPESDLNRRLAVLNTLSLELGLTPEVIQPGQRVQGKLTPEIPIRYEVLGSVGDIYGLLGIFDRQFPDLHLRGITIEHTGPETVRLRTVLSWMTAPAS